jgi:hypothetical protein
MSANNLAIVIGPNLLVSPDESALSMLDDMQASKQVILSTHNNCFVVSHVIVTIVVVVRCLRR